MMTNSKLIYFVKKSIDGNHSLLRGEGFNASDKVCVYSAKGTQEDYFLIFVKNGNSNSKTLCLRYSFTHRKEGEDKERDYDGRFTIALYGDKAVQRNVDELVSWVQKGPVEFNMLRKFLVDAEALMSKWEVLHAFLPVLFKSLLSFLEESPVGIRRFKKIYNDLTAAYYDYFAAANDEAKSRQDSVFRYLDLCFDNQNQDWFHDRGEIREQKITVAVNKLLAQKGTENELGVENDWNRKRKRVLQKAQSWLLSRYNLWEASKIAFNRQAWWQRWIFLSMPEFLLVILVVWLCCGPVRPIQMYDKNWLLGIFYLVSIVGAVGWVVCSGESKWKNFLGGLDRNIQLFLPRLAAGIIVGYLVLFNDEPWRCVFEGVLHFSGKDGPWPAWPRVILPLLGVLVNVYIETNNMTGHKIGWKPIFVFLRGCAYSALIGVAVSDVFGASMAEYHKALPAFQGFFGTIYPKVIFCHAPLALFIGVFLQLLWEDKTLTEKI
jgi:hypothetical protein